jgi:hypothetical protein
MDTRDTFRDCLILITVGITIGSIMSFLLVTRYTASANSKFAIQLAESL